MQRPIAMTTACLFVVMAWSMSGFALSPDLDISQYAHTSWKIRDGFTKGKINAITQTLDGYLWLGTDFGLLRFDGVRAVPWQPPADQHLPSNTIRSLLAARDGTLWVGTAKGLLSWKDGKLTQYPELAGQLVTGLLEDHEGLIWVGTLGLPSGRLCAIHTGSVHCDGADGGLGPGPFGLYEDSKGNLWAGVMNGLWRWKPGLPKFYSLPGDLNGIQSFAEDADGALLIGWKGGVYRFVDGKTEAGPVSRHERQSRIETLLRDREGSLWIGTLDRGLVHLHQGRTDAFTQSDGLSGSDVSRIFVDREGNTWVATLDGLDRFRKFAVSTLNVREGLADAIVGSVLASTDGTVWFGTFGGFNRWDDGQVTIPRTGSARLDGKLDGHAPTSLFQDKHGRIWVATTYKFGYLENGRFEPLSEIPGGVVHSIAEDPTGNLWIANQALGLISLSPQHQVQQIPWSGLGHKDPAGVLASDPSRGGLWLGFYQGGLAYLADGKVQASYSSTNGLGEGIVNDLRFDRDGTLWAATEGGLSRLKDGHVATLTSKDGLPCDGVHWTFEDDAHSLWLRAPCGLVRIAASELEAWTDAADHGAHLNRAIRATLFDISDGVRSFAYAGGYSPRVARSADGKLWFTGEDGVSVIDPLHIPFNNVPPPVHIEQVIADHEAFGASGKLRLPALVRNLEIDYTALSLVAADKVLFRYKLDGVDRDWQDVRTRRQAFYTTLRPGTYHFHVIACNNDGVWNEAGDHLEFSIAPAWFQTNLFLVLCVAAFFLLFWMLYELRVRSIQQRTKQLASVNEKLEKQIAENAALVADLELQVGLLQRLPVSAWTLQSDGTPDFVNQVWLEFAGQTLSFIRSHPEAWMTAIHPDDREMAARIFREGVDSGSGFAIQTRSLRAQDGTYRWHLQQAVVLRDEDGKVLKFVGTTTDIDDQKRAEEALRQAQGDLARISRVTTMGELTASLAHELSQPMSGVITNASVGLRKLRRDQPDLDEVRAVVTRIGRDAHRAAEILKRIRLQFERGAPDREVLDMDEILKETLALLRDEAVRYDVSVRMELTADLPKILGDRVQLQQVAMNLIVNSIEAMKDVDGTREIVLQSQRAENQQILVSVSDTGRGVAPELAEQIFDPFFTTKPRGTGMGLRISRSIIESHGGRLWAELRPAHGATFHLSLPATIPGTG
ncbi:PAS domain S-box-containing protein [Bryocella elongata]|uniref:histidine kinase n=1 Tax=Bryocella elongata TaxID=863522 RepID=A0A1H5UY62_9BACT|nr:two-component regulator propeller domain-containing protein [Bryocella elongata]SEF80019.1 PAS domain S-box-containing protein [Bryocella elongata]